MVMVPFDEGENWQLDVASSPQNKVDAEGGREPPLARAGMG